MRKSGNVLRRVQALPVDRLGSTSFVGFQWGKLAMEQNEKSQFESSWGMIRKRRFREKMMATLHIEHGITNFTTWKAAFNRFATKRSEAGVTAHRIHQPHDDAAYVVLQLDFPSVEQAQAFVKFLETRVWSVPENSPGLAGSPRARVLVPAPEQ